MGQETEELLNDSRVKAIVTTRRRSADNAAQAKTRYERSGVGFIVFGAVAAIAGALILLGTGGEGAEEVIKQAKLDNDAQKETLALFQSKLAEPAIRMSLFIVEIIALFLSAYYAQRLRSSKSDERWMAERRAAEQGRIALHETIQTVAQEKDGGTPGVYEVAAFDHFLEKQLASQISHYATNGERSEKSAWRVNVVGALLAGLVAAAGASGIVGTWFVVLGAFVGVITPILMNALSKYQDIKLDRELSIAYAETWKILVEIQGNSDPAKIKLAAGDATLSREVIQKTHAAMKAENEAWTPTKSPF